MFKMPRRREEISKEALAALRQDLLRLSVPHASSNFDARVHAALSRPERGRLHTLWVAARPAISAAAFSLLATLALLKGMSLTAAPPSGVTGTRATVAYGSPSSAGAADINAFGSVIP